VRAVVVERFGALPQVRDVPDPVPAPHGVVVRVAATGLCRSDWHAWQGHDPDVVLPHVPGHELAGTIVEVGAEVRHWRPGVRVTVPFVCACGSCDVCRGGDAQVCPHQSQPGFTGWGSFAELVALDHADTNLVALPDDLDDATAAALGCRVATAYRAVTARGRVQPGEWLSVHGCGGVGLSAVAVGVALGGRVVAVDRSPAALDAARSLGAEVLVDASVVDDVPSAVAELTGGGAHVAVDALGSAATCADSLLSLRRRGRQVQVGLVPAATGHPAVPMERVIAYELDVLGSHGMAAADYPALLDLVVGGRLPASMLVRRRIPLDGVPAALALLGEGRLGPGITVALPAAG
jgi:D-arabinose 1-dehydrogenase-like Zn-dependent alcohol dehydrogenase